LETADNLNMLLVLTYAACNLARRVERAQGFSALVALLVLIGSCSGKISEPEYAQGR
jgi:hypothetical protein